MPDPLAHDAAQLIAFYLPQFHPIPENDAWWGEGFTEWTNVASARPNFVGHLQPRLPGDLGFYDLRVAETRAHQARLARVHGLAAFCYYHYWFAGRRLLQRPFDEVLASGAPDYPFCLCWANESWTRQWDGRANDILMEQTYSPEDDVRFMESLLPAFADARYWRLEGRPLLLVYRAAALPEPRATVSRWNSVCRAHGVAPPYLVAMQSFYDISDPREGGFDAAAEFPPHTIRPEGAQLSNQLLNARYPGGVYLYDSLVELMMNRAAPQYPLYRGVMAGWDNTPRRQDRPAIFVNATLEAYERWLRHAVETTCRQHPPGRRLVFINAWNEWGEGCYLEPDRHNGRAYLEATRRASEAGGGAP